MPEIQIYNTEDLITLESKKQAVVIIGFSLSKSEEQSQGDFSRRIFSFLDSLGYTYSLQITKSSCKLFIFLSSSTAGEVINKVTILLERMDRVRPADSTLVLSPANHANLSSFLQAFVQTPISKTKNPRIVQIGKRFWIFASLHFSKLNERYFTKYLKDILISPFSNVTIGVKTQKTKKNDKIIQRGIVFSKNFASYEEGQAFLTKITKISLQYRNRISFSLRFHSAKEVKQKKIEFLFGLVKLSSTPAMLEELLQIDKFIPFIIPKKTEEQAKQELGEMKEKKDERVAEPIFPFGMPVSNEEIKKLMKTIPPPPT